MVKMTDAQKLALAKGLIKALPHLDLSAAPRRGRNHGGMIMCCQCGKPTGQYDHSGLGDSSGLCPLCAQKLSGWRR